MMILTTVAKPYDEKVSRVFWRVSLTRNGIVDVEKTGGDNAADELIIAELCAIQHLLFEKMVLDREPAGGEGYKLVVSKGAIKKLINGKSAKSHLQAYSSFLYNRMNNCSLVVEHKMDLMADEHNTVPVIINQCSSKYTGYFNSVSTPALGEVYITAHAVKQYAERITGGTPKKPWSSLVGRLNNPGLIQVALPNNVMKHKLKKYGDVDNIENWTHTTSLFNYLVINNNGKRTLVTVYIRAN